MSKGTPTINVSDEQFKAVTTVAKSLGVTPATIANLVLQSVATVAEDTLGTNRVDFLKAQAAPDATKVVSPVKLPISSHTKRVVSQLARVLQLSEELIAMWSIYTMLPEFERVRPVNRHTLPPAIQNKVLTIERNPHATTRD